MNDVELAILAEANVLKAKHYMRFFKTGKGQYGEGDLFLGLSNPQMHAITKRFYAVVDNQMIHNLLISPYHEFRMVALLCLVRRFEKRKTQSERKEIVDFYLAHLDYVNNWDLVDLSCYKILGKYLLAEPNREVLYQLAASGHLWRQRVAIVSTMALIKGNDEYADTLKLSELMLHHKHDLMHKAIGWLLREIGKRNLSVLRAFLLKHAAVMPRTMLRYSIEKMDHAERLQWLNARN